MRGETGVDGLETDTTRLSYDVDDCCHSTYKCSNLCQPWKRPRLHNPLPLQMPVIGSDCQQSSWTWRLQMCYAGGIRWTSKQASILSHLIEIFHAIVVCGGEVEAIPRGHSGRHRKQFTSFNANGITRTDSWSYLSHQFKILNTKLFPSSLHRPAALLRVN